MSLSERAEAIAKPVRLNGDSLENAIDCFARCIGGRKTKITAAVAGYILAEQRRGFAMAPIDLAANQSKTTEGGGDGIS